MYKLHASPFDLCCLLKCVHFSARTINYQFPGINYWSFCRFDPLNVNQCHGVRISVRIGISMDQAGFKRVSQQLYSDPKIEMKRWRWCDVSDGNHDDDECDKDDKVIGEWAMAMTTTTTTVMTMMKLTMLPSHRRETSNSSKTTLPLKRQSC